MLADNEKSLPHSKPTIKVFVFKRICFSHLCVRLLGHRKILWFIIPSYCEKNHSVLNQAISEGVNVNAERLGKGRKRQTFPTLRNSGDILNPESRVRKANFESQ